MSRIAVFASGNGSNFQAIVEAIRNKLLDATVCLLVSDNPEAFAVDRARQEDINTFIFQPKQYASKDEFEKEILEQLRLEQIELIVLAGYMRLIGNTLLNAYPRHIINIHPSLLPAFPGKDAIGQAISAGVKETGVTVHFVDEGMDTGTVIEQIAVPILENDTRESLQERIQYSEHQFYPSVLKKLLDQE
ncbi:phosphoribosylglycinamide formyltransferase [Peribacillus saganii]|uniref:Phosphoribosylglycinamide formyltransferase n=1 Tax=Peribacillus saganii TaxID=2303992 RepID=A0A372LN05_9BACI|nr:phosphoribosylglycinamide formyltransferase [Peribacillus saganii]RFU68908.1 phosphoribosylglycinamide formyltransferase [Peribacillus saganii]